MPVELVLVYFLESPPVSIFAKQIHLLHSKSIWALTLWMRAFIRSEQIVVDLMCIRSDQLKMVIVFATLLFVANPALSNDPLTFGIDTVTGLVPLAAWLVKHLGYSRCVEVSRKWL